MRLIWTKTGVEVAKGDKAVTFRNEPVTVTGWEKPRHGGSTGRIYVELNGQESGFYPSVVDAAWIEREDQI